MKLTRVLMIVALLPLAAGCRFMQPSEPVVVQVPAQQPVAAPKADAVMLVSYSVPEGKEEMAQNILSSVLWRKDSPVGRVHRGGAGMIHVVAPASVQAGVADFVKPIATAPQRAPATIQMDYWRVAVAADGSPSSTLPEIKEALDAVGANKTFKVMSHKTLLSQEGHHAENRSRDFRVEQNIARDADGIVGNLGLKSEIGEVDTRVRLKVGQSLVLGQLGPTDGPVYYVVRATVL